MKIVVIGGTGLIGSKTVAILRQGGHEVTLTPGQTFYEDPNDVHVVSRNASKTTPAKYLVFLVKEKGAPVVIPVK